MILNTWIRGQKLSFAFGTSSIGQRIQNPSLDGRIQKRLHIITDSSAKNQFIEAFYSLKDHFEHIDIQYLGCLKNDNPEFAIPLLSELLLTDTHLLVLSSSSDFMTGIFNALSTTKKGVHMCLFNDRLDVLQEEPTKRMIASERLNNLVFAGHQRHFCSVKELSFINKNFSNHLSLGDLNQDIDALEPIVRESDACTFSCKTIQSAEQPNGLNNYQACQVMKQMGMSNNLKILNLCDLDDMHPSLVGQMIWYFTEGIGQKEVHLDFKEPAYFQEHIVHIESTGTITFLKSTQTGRWWFEVPSSNPDERGSIHPCTKMDYLKAQKNELSDFIIEQMNQIV